MQPGDVIDPIQLTTIRGASVAVPTSARWTHLQLRRFAGCPICNLHLRGVARRHTEITALGVHVIAVFHSTAETMRPFQADLPFDVVADPDKALYRLFGAETSLRSVADPRAWGALVRGVFASHPSGMGTGEGGHLGLPAEFLIAKGGRIAACKYGTHADDQWSVDELIERARDSL